MHRKHAGKFTHGGLPTSGVACGLPAWGYQEARSDDQAGLVHRSRVQGFLVFVEYMGRKFISKRNESSLDQCPRALSLVGSTLACRRVTQIISGEVVPRQQTAPPKTSPERAYQ